MKYSQSAAPYLVVLVFVLLGLPFINYQAQQTQQLVVTVDLEKTKTNLANTTSTKQKEDHLLVMSDQ